MGNSIYRGVVREEPPSDPPEKGDVRVSYGKFRVAAPWTAVALALGIVGGGAAATHLRPPDTATQSAAYAELVHKLEESERKAYEREQAQAIVNAALLNRMSSVETKLGALDATNVALLAAIRSR